MVEMTDFSSGTTSIQFATDRNRDFYANLGRDLPKSLFETCKELPKKALGVAMEHKWKVLGGLIAIVALTAASYYTRQWLLAAHPAYLKHNWMVKVITFPAEIFDAGYKAVTWSSHNYFAIPLLVIYKPIEWLWNKIVPEGLKIPIFSFFDPAAIPSAQALAEIQKLKESGALSEEALAEVLRKHNLVAVVVSKDIAVKLQKNKLLAASLLDANAAQKFTGFFDPALGKQFGGAASVLLVDPATAASLQSQGCAIQLTVAQSLDVVINQTNAKLPSLNSLYELPDASFSRFNRLDFSKVRHLPSNFFPEFNYTLIKESGLFEILLLWSGPYSAAAAWRGESLI